MFHNEETNFFNILNFRSTISHFFLSRFFFYSTIKQEKGYQLLTFNQIHVCRQKQKSLISIPKPLLEPIGHAYVYTYQKLGASACLIEEQILKNHIFGQYHDYSEKMKLHIVSELLKPWPILRLVFASVALRERFQSLRSFFFTTTNCKEELSKSRSFWTECKGSHALQQK